MKYITSKSVICCQMTIRRKDILLVLISVKSCFTSYSFLFFQIISCLISTIFLDLLTLGILTIAQPNGLAVPDASMHPVESTSDVLELMEIGLRNRAVGATALNERSSRSHRSLY